MISDMPTVPEMVSTKYKEECDENNDVPDFCDAIKSGLPPDDNVEKGAHCKEQKNPGESTQRGRIKHIQESCVDPHDKLY